MKRILSMVIVLLVLTSLASSSAETVTAFTHPEIGEFIVFSLENHMPYFTIYGFTQYRIMDSSNSYRGITGYGLDSAQGSGVGLEASLNLLYDSIEGKSKEPIPVVFEYTGLLDEYSYQLNALPKNERIKAIELLGGFEGADSYEKLKKIEGFEDADIASLADNYVYYTVVINGEEIPYRVLMFYIEEDSWEEIYYERYCYVQIDNEWKLCRIAKEYYSDYQQRIKYIHGLAGTDEATLQKGYSEILQGRTWNITPNELTNVERVSDGTFLVRGAQLFRMPVSLSYSFSDGWLSSIQYELGNAESYYSAFISLYMRFYDPTTIDDNGDMSWSLPDMLITLRPDEGSPKIIVTPRIDQSSLVVG